ncbi:PAS domain-containing protein [Shewanella schlegeliana]|uniref:PAS domain-containing protein n=1 Tax=Shewanella schlegeliana TaxID=190308 RepID=A0ABS1SV51_9GAMM|nr:PAS domain-containing protein [Shewanella schlegeliana]MBL4912412.1 PAS domain-containing protein [Shewanella schlegeliana]MCL1108118.1 PAS domain-containing protein [Shewanella schlegeliana]GIU21862.1 diguanylate cyclase [Shewanella schlegeliana]
MLTRKLPLLINAQGIHWSQQRILAAVSQICMLLVTVIILTNIIITLGERRLQEDWATQRYSELQAVGAMISDKVSFQQFRTQMFAKSELLKHYLTLPSPENQDKLLDNWDILVDNIPELLGIALYDPQGQYKFATSNDFGQDSLPHALLGPKRNMGGNEIYTSPLEFTPINGQLEPYMYQFAWLENPNQSIRGYIVTYNSMSKMLTSIKPAYSSKQAPLMMLDTQGLLYAGAQSEPSISRLPETMGGSLKQSYPALWRKMAMSNFGQFHGDAASFVYLKVELTTQYETRREYFLVSYIKNEDIAAKFAQWRNILIGGAILLTLLASLVIFLAHLYRLVQRSREFSIGMTNRLFDSDVGCIIANESGRVLIANPAASKLLALAIEDLSDRSLQRILNLDDDQYSEFLHKMDTEQQWYSELNTETTPYTWLKIRVRIEVSIDKKRHYMLVTFEDISELKQSQKEAMLNYLLNNGPMACVLTDAKGLVVKSNDAFDSLLQIEDSEALNVNHLLSEDFSSHWPQIAQQLIIQGTWKGQVFAEVGHIKDSYLQATLKGYLDAAGELEYILCSFEHARLKPTNKDSGTLVPHRSTIFNHKDDLVRYFNNLSQQSKDFSSLLMIDISAEGMLSHMSDIGQLESRQKEVEVHLLRDLPHRYQMSHWQLGKLIVVLPDTDSDQAHYFAIDTLNKLNDNGLGEGIFIGIASYQTGQDLEQFIANAEVALKRAKHTGEQHICQAYTRQIT